MQVMKQLIILLIASTILFAQEKSIDDKNEKQTIYNFLVYDIDSNEVSLSKYYGDVLLIINVASECGNTPQYEGLQNIYEKYHDKGFEILAFPCNDFGGQEPGSNKEIKYFCSTTYDVTFNLFDKVKILGEDKNELYEYLITEVETDKGDVKWNFEKFLISRDGEIIKRFRSNVKPENKEITSAIENELSKKNSTN